MPTKYQIVAHTIQEQITAGFYQPKDKLPNQKQLAALFSVNRLTVKKALDSLEAKGLIYKQSGLGTFVAPQPCFRQALDIPLETAFDSQVKPEILKINVGLPDLKIGKILQLGRFEPVFTLYILLKDQTHCFLQKTFLPVKLVPKLAEAKLTLGLKNYLLEQYGFKFGGSFNRIHATYADSLDVKYLNLPPKSPVLELNRLTWLSNGQMLAYTVRHDSSQANYTVSCSHQ